MLEKELRDIEINKLKQSKTKLKLELN